MAYWPVPYSAALNQQFLPGQFFSVKGKVFDNIDKDDNNSRICLNLSADGEGCDAATIPLHVNLRFDENEIVMNSKNDGEWADEDKSKLRINEGEEFDLRVRAHDDCFEIELNSKEVGRFDHRLPLDSVSHVFIDGPFHFYKLEWTGRYYSSPHREEVRFREGKRMFMTGTPKDNPHRFVINLINDDGDICMHFNPRFDHKEVVRNTKQNGEWQEEEKEGDFPFRENVSFDLAIDNEDDAFQVYLNDEHFCTYNHRLGRGVREIEIDGDVELQAIHVFGK